MVKIINKAIAVNTMSTKRDKPTIIKIICLININILMSKKEELLIKQNSSILHNNPSILKDYIYSSIRMLRRIFKR